MTPEQLSDTIVQTLDGLVSKGAVNCDSGVPRSVTIERPRQKEHGDYATNVAMQLAKRVGMAPRQLAELIADELVTAPGVKAVDVAGPGFLNITVAADAQAGVAAEIVAAGAAYGANDTFAGQRINLEFVSANPTGPIHLGGVRWAAVGDALGRIFEASGAEVTREYYFNDHGAQIDRFSSSLLAAARDEPPPDDGYAGAYIEEIAAEVVASHPDVLDAADPQEVFRSEGVALMFAEIKRSLRAFGVEFDVFFHEHDLHRSGAVERAIERLADRGVIYEESGARWLASERFGDDKDRVIVKSDGEAAYLAGDLAYYLDKRERGFDRCIIMLGADHHGYVGRMMAMCAAFGDEPGVNLEILIGQLVNLVRGGEPVRMSKRAGTVVAIDDLVDAIGVDASRYALTRYSTDSKIDIDLELWASATSDNPVYYVQYAHARVASILRRATESGLVWSADSFEPGLLSHDHEGDLLRSLAEFPSIVTAAAELREPHRIARYLEETAGRYHRFYDTCRVLPGDGEPTAEIHRARLVLVDATRIVLANGLRLLGVSAPERM